VFQKSVAWEAKQLAVRPFPLAREPPESCRLPKSILLMNEISATRLCEGMGASETSAEPIPSTPVESTGSYRKREETRGN